MNLVLSTEGVGGVFHTIQGEGKLVGYPTIFVRLSQCNLRCEWKNTDGTTTRCDTPHTSFNPELNNRRTVQEVVEQILAIDCKHVVVTGGEPYFQKAAVYLINWLNDVGRHVTVETNGTIYRESRADLLSISVKLSSSCASPEFGAKQEKQRVNLDALASFVRSAADYQFKFVLNDEIDVTEIQDLIDELNFRTGTNISDKVWIMPQGVTQQQLDSKMEWLVSVSKRYQWKVSDRLHIRLWGHTKGV